MIAQVVLAILLASTSALPRTYQDRQFYYQPLPVQQQLLNYQIPQIPQIPTQRFQVPAATQLLPNNVNTGIRYGQQQLIYVVPAGSQVIFDEQGQEGGQGGVTEGIINLWNGVSSYFPSWGGTQEKPGENANAGTVAGGATTGAAPEKPTESKPEKTEQKPVKIDEEQKQRYYLFGQPQNVQQFQQSQFQQAQFQQALPQLQNLPYFAPRPAVASPNQNLLYYKNYAQSDSKPGSAAMAFSRLLQKSSEEKPSSSETTTTTGSPNQEESEGPNEELGPSIAQAKPQAVSVAGPGGVAAAAPVGTAIVGPGGMALSAPTATAVAGTKPSKPQDKDKYRSYFPRTSYYPY